MAKTDDTLTPEDAVRLYLMYLEDPAKLIDAAAVKQLEKEVAAAKDPIERAKAMAAVRRAKGVDGESYTKGFIRFGKQWADEEDIPMAVLEELNVPADVLQAAGFGEQKPARGRSTKAKSEGTRKPRTSPDQLADDILSYFAESEFTLKDVMEKIGGSPVTVKDVVAKLVKDERLTPGPGRKGLRGKPASTWKVN